MRRLILLLVLTLTACGSSAPVESAIGEGYADEWPRIGQETLAKWASFPVGTGPRPLVLIGDQVKAEKGFADDNAKSAFAEGRIDANGKVPPEAAEAFTKITKPGAAEPKLKVLSAAQGKAVFGTDRGPAELPAWIFELTGAHGPVAVLAARPDYQRGATVYGAKVSPDGLTLTVTMPAAPVACGGEPRITYFPEWLESPTAVAVGLKKQTGEVMAGTVGTCHRMERRPADYTVKLGKPLGNRVLVGGNGQPLPVTGTQP
jgi:hypothetical protein